jgi:hypothetical protein
VDGVELVEELVVAVVEEQVTVAARVLVPRGAALDPAALCDCSSGMG